MQGSGSGSGSGDIDMFSVALYADVRALLQIPDVIYVSGRTVEGDGGQGWFQLIPASTETDDEGIYYPKHICNHLLT